MLDLSKMKDPKEIELPPLETFENAYSGREYHIDFTIPEFNAICPMSGLPDFGTIHLDYVPDKVCIELKSLKLYIVAFRNVGIFHEHVINRILDDFVAACDPLQVDVRGEFSVRGGITTIVSASFHRPDSKQ